MIHPPPLPVAPVPAVEPVAPVGGRRWEPDRTRPRLRVVSLASGSSGNAYLLQTDDGALLLDAGVSMRKIERCLAELDLASRELAGILVTHEHSDHVSGLLNFAKRHGVSIWGNEATLTAAAALALECVVVQPGVPFTIAGAEVVPFGLPHDSASMMSYAFAWGGKRVCFLTDLGHCPEAAMEQARGADLLVLESNHDVARLTTGPYPVHLQRRILGPRGHLSNAQAADVAVACVSGRRQAIWLAHLSAQNNDPIIALGVVEAALARHGVATCDVQVAARDRRSLVWDAEPQAVQLRLL